MNQQGYPQIDYHTYKKLLHRHEGREIMSAGFALGSAIIAYLFLQTIAASSLEILGLSEAYHQSSMFQNLFNVVAVHIFSMLLPFGAMAIMMRKRFVTPVVPTKKVGVLPFWSWVAIGLALCYMANYAVAFIMALFKQFGYTLTKSEYTAPSSVLDCIALVISSAIIPAIIEELSLRGFGMGILRKHGKAFSAFAISIVFGLMHGNVIQFVFAFLVGLILAYVTIQTDSIVPAMVIHGLNNGVATAQTIITFGAGKKIATAFVAGWYYVWLIIAVLAAIYLFSKHMLLPKKEAKSPYAMGFFKKLIYLAPGMALPILMLIYLSAKTIVKTGA